MSKKEKEIGHPSGLSPSDNGQFPEELEGSVKAFSKATGFWDEPNARTESDQPTSEPHGEPGFVMVEDQPLMDGDRGPKIVHEDPDRLERQRVDQQDEIVAVYDKATDSEKAELRPKESKS